MPGPAILDAAHGDSQWIRAAGCRGPTTSPALGTASSPRILCRVLGDCWLLCALSAVAEFPGFVENSLFKTEVSDGKCVLRLYDAKARKMVHVTVDDRVPCGKATWWEAPRPLFSQPHGNEMYVLILEKAFAKLAGGYRRLSGGYPSCVAHLTGCEDLSIWHAEGFRVGRTSRGAGGGQKGPARLPGPVHAGLRGDQGRRRTCSPICSTATSRITCSPGLLTGTEIEKQRDDGLVERHAY